MSKTSAGSYRKKDVALTKRYGKIGISAVAAATRYQGKGKNETSPQPRVRRISQRMAPDKKAGS